MATEITNQGRPGSLSNLSGSALSMWGNFTSFLSDVRAEMKKVVTPTRKEVQATTTVVIITVFVFGAYFFITDKIFGAALQVILHKMGAQ